MQQKEFILNTQFGIWEEKQKQKGGFLPINASLAKPLLVSATHALGGEILQGHEVKSSDEEKDPKEEEEEGLAMPRNNISLQRHPAPKRVQLPNGRIRVGRDRLPKSVRIRRTFVRKIGPRNKKLEE